MALIRCGECSKEVSDKASSCPGCGAPIKKYQEFSQQPMVVIGPKSRSLSMVLALFLGGLGIHKFYLNRPGWGLIYLIFCWTFIPTILGFIEALNYLFMSDQTFQARYAQDQYKANETIENILAIKNHEDAPALDITESEEPILQKESIPPQKICTSCSAQISIYEEKCPKCGDGQLTKPHTTSTVFVVGNVLFGLFIVGLIILKVFFMESSNNNSDKFAQSYEITNTEATSMEAEAIAEAPIEIDSDTLSYRYNSNEVKADAEFNGKLLNVSGMVMEIEKDEAGNISISLSAGGDPYVYANIEKAERQKVIGLYIAQKITVQCRGNGKHYSNVILVNCIVI